MTVRLNPYLSFRDNARDAMEFYRSVLGGELEVMTFEQMPGSDPAEADKIMHSMLTTPDGLVLMGADTPNAMPLNVGDSITVSLSGDDVETLGGWFEALADGGTVTAPFMQAPWGDTFGMLTDRFGVNWMVNATAA
ncbi:VOC family protein [Gordonia sp. TBRC 11910]|uniref:VOC family protein n=1 Tax=Gordonia asplenii TaxID=2725283 RepID=A0A848L235_9ACTN|nr:VOC family protein [Gordonia asplenii]NMO04527.1 VOC family protein [Gordonia asplenii]